MKGFVFAGEKSGDLHGAPLIRALKKHMNLEITAVAGPEMRKEPIDLLLPMEDFERMGFGDLLTSLPTLYSQFSQVERHILNIKPDLVILIDYPGFNLRLAKALRKKGYKGKLVQYVAPTFWAWGKGRKQTLIDNYDLLLSIYPFEKEAFAGTPLHVSYVGNPVQESVRNYTYDPQWRERLGIPVEMPLIALFPGSRSVEVKRNLPLQLEAACRIQEKRPSTLFGLSCAHADNMALMEQMLASLPLKINKDLFLIPKAYSYELMRDSRSALAKSGTVTLELALHKCPSAVMYQMSWFNGFIAKHLLRLNLPHYCMANILKQDTLFPELIQNGCTAEGLVNALLPLHDEGAKREHCIRQCEAIDNLLERRAPSEEAAQAILYLT